MRGLDVLAQLVEAGDDFRRIHAHARDVGAVADGAEIHLITRHDLEEGAEGGGDEFLDRRGLLALLAQLRTDGERGLVADRLIDLFFRLEVVVERARGERRGADDVAHGRGAITHVGKHTPRRLQDHLAVLDLGLLALAGRACGLGWLQVEGCPWPGI